MDPKEEFRVYMKAVSRGLEDDSSLHISEEALIAYQQDRLGGPERNRVQHHFTKCSTCFDRFKDVSDFFQPARREEESLSEATIAREWETFRRQILMQEQQSAVDVRRSKFRTPFFAPRALALAATLLIILTAGWGFWLANQRAQLARQLETEQALWAEKRAELDRENRRLQEENKEAGQNEVRLKQLEKDHQELQRQAALYESEIAALKQPELNSPIYDIYEQGSAQRSTSDEPDNSVVISRNSKAVTLILNGADQPEHGVYVIEMLNQNGRLRWRREGLRRDNLGNFVVTLNRASLGQGRVLLKIYGRSGKRSELIAQYSLSVRVQD
jgi:hypothetical protein